VRRQHDLPVSATQRHKKNKKCCEICGNIYSRKQRDLKDETARKEISMPIDFRRDVPQSSALAMFIVTRRDTDRTSATARTRHEFAHYDCQGKENAIENRFLVRTGDTGRT
jgi:hypothetical protein